MICSVYAVRLEMCVDVAVHGQGGHPEQAIPSKNRRTTGHDNIALKALNPLLPSWSAFLTLWVYSSITASDGSLPMASVRRQSGADARRRAHGGARGCSSVLAKSVEVRFSPSKSAHRSDCYAVRYMAS